MVKPGKNYYLFGMQQMPQRSMETPEAPRERFTGHEKDDETGLLYAGSRYYDPVVARWMVVDPQAARYPSWSPYNYVFNNPLIWTDPDGECPTCYEFLKGVAKGGYARAKSFVGDVVTAVQTSEGRDGLLRSMAPIAPASPGDDRSMGEVYSDMYEGTKASVSEAAATLESGNAEEIGVLVGAAAVTVVATALSRRGAFRQAKRDLGLPMSADPTVRRVPMTDRNGKAILDSDGKPIITREYVFTREDGSVVVIQDHSAGHQFGEGGRGDQGPHFNVRPEENTRTGRVPGTQDGCVNYFV